MRLLADENFPGAAVAALRRAGFDVLWVAEANPGIADEAILDLCASTQRTLPTFDKDFGELAYKAGLPAQHGVVLFRVTSNSRRDRRRCRIGDPSASGLGWSLRGNHAPRRAHSEHSRPTLTGDSLLLQKPLNAARSSRALLATMGFMNATWRPSGEGTAQPRISLAVNTLGRLLSGWDPPPSHCYPIDQVVSTISIASRKKPKARSRLCYPQINRSAIESSASAWWKDYKLELPPRERS